MAIQLWSRFESASDVTSPTLGTGGAEVGSPTYIAAKFGNGMYSDTTNEGCTFPTAANGISIDKGTIEFWAKVNFDTNSSTSHYFFDCNLASNGAVKLQYSGTFKDLYAEIKSGGVVVATATSVGVSWSSGDIIHFALTWDKDGGDIGDSKTLAIYMDNVEQASDTDTWSSSPLNTNIFIGTRVDGGYESDSVIDNLKAYNTVKVDFSDRDMEGPLSPSVFDSVGVTEDIDRDISNPLVSVFDSVTVADLFFFGVLSVNISDAVSVGEDVTASMPCINVQEFVNVMLVPSISVVDTPSVADVLTVLGLTRPVDVSDSVSVAEDVTTFFRNWVLSVNDGVTLAENVSPIALSYNLSISDAVTVAEVISSLALLANISISEAISVLERIYLEWWAGITKDPTTWSDVEVEDTEYSDVAVGDTEWSDISKDDTEWSDITKDDTVWSDVR